MPDGDSRLDDTALIIGELQGGFTAMNKSLDETKTGIAQLHTRLSNSENLHRTEHVTLNDKYDAKITELETAQAVNKARLGVVIAGIAAFVSGAVSLGARLAARMVG